MIALAVVLIPDVVEGTIEEQRSRLPPPATCEDPVEGTWLGYMVRPDEAEWREFTLEIRRDPTTASALTGHITNHGWDGDASQTEPPVPCTGLHFEVGMTAVGTYDEHTRSLYFGGTSWQIDAMHCTDTVGFYYNLDHFTGTIDPAIQEFQSLNNDGGDTINVPTVFRRVGCFGPEVAGDPLPTRPSVEVRPPSLYPRTGGCGRRRR